MSRQTQKQERKFWMLRNWKVVDDYSGFVYPSEDVKINWKGIISSPDNYDPPHPVELPLSLSPPRPLPYTRPDLDSTDAGAVFVSTFSLSNLENRGGNS